MQIFYKVCEGKLPEILNIYMLVHLSKSKTAALVIDLFATLHLSGSLSCYR